VRIPLLKSVPEPLVYLLIAAAAIALYANSMAGDFVCDDRGLILRNERIHSLGNVPDFFREPFSQEHLDGRSTRYYRPPVSASFALDYAIAGSGNPWFFHLTNVLAYGACAALAYGLVRKLVSDRLGAALAGLLFATLAIHSESVAWIAGRTDVLACAFMCAAMLCLLALRGPAAEPAGGTTRRAPALLAAAFGLALLAMLSKEVALALAPIWVVFELTCSRKGPLAARPGRRVASLAVLLGATAVYLALRSAALGQAGAGAGVRSFDPWTFRGLATVATIVWQYLGKLVLPVHLSLGFEVEPVLAAVALVPLACLVGAAALLAASGYAVFRWPAVALALWWMWLGVAPALNFVAINETAAERFLFVPSLGFCMLVGLALQRIRSRGAADRRWATAATVAVAVLIGAQALGAVARNPDWRSQRALYFSTILTSPRAPLSHAMAGEVYASAAYAARRAQPLYGRSLELAPAGTLSRFVAHNNLGKMAMDAGDLYGALDHLRQAVALNPRHPVPRATLVLVLMEIGRTEDLPQGWSRGKEEAEALVREHPEHAAAGVAHGGLARFWAERGNWPTALKHARRAFTIMPNEQTRALVEAIERQARGP